MRIRNLLLGAGVIAATAACVSSTTGDTQPGHRLVMEVSADDPRVWDAVLNNVENLQTVFGADATAVELVTHGGGLGMLLGTNSAQAQRMEKLAAGGVVFAACENTMKRKKITPADLLPFVTIVDSGIAEVVRKQEQGWPYVKSGS